jgi:hypothetical protein
VLVGYVLVGYVLVNSWQTLLDAGSRRQTLSFSLEQRLSA